MFDNWKGQILVNDKECSNLSSKALTELGGPVKIKLVPKGMTPIEPVLVAECSETTEYIITVKSYMTQKSTEDFAFMKNFNKDIPMPLMTMVGTKEKETPKMFYMKLHGDIIAKTVDTCMCCGRVLENPISRYFGMGPICGEHNYVSPFESEEELNAAVESYRAKLQQITWEGWIPKSAIVKEVVKDA